MKFSYVTICVVILRSLQQNTAKNFILLPPISVHTQPWSKRPTTPTTVTTTVHMQLMLHKLFIASSLNPW